VVFNRLTGEPTVAFPDTEQPTLVARFDELRRIALDQGPFSHDRAISVLRALLLHAAEFKLRNTNQETTDTQIRLSRVVLEFQNLVEQTYTERKEASFYSDSLGITLATLNRKVKDELGQSVMQIVSERLAIAARVALRSGERSIKEVAFELGFEDPLYFSRFFRKQFGCAPSQYFTDVGGSNT